MYKLLQFVKNRALCAKKYRNGKRGFTIAEAAIALTVITLVTVTALTLFTTSENATLRENAETAALYLASDAVECFRTTDTTDAFCAALEFAGGELWELERNGYGDYAVKYARADMIVEIKIDTPEGAATTENADISIMASYNGHNVWKTPYTFRKGVGADA